METNPYQPPLARLVDPATASDVALAGRGQRLGAVLIDALLGMAAAVPWFLLTGVWDYVRQGQTPPVALTIGGAVYGFVAFVLIHGYFLKQRGQTVGKKLLRVRIADMQGGVPPLPVLLGKRYLPVQLVGTIPIVGPLLTIVDALFIFREDRRCVHDHIAGTRVVAAQ